MKRINFILFMAGALTAFSCQVNRDDNKPLDYDSLQVQFKATLSGADWGADARVGVLSSCTRDGQEGVSMSAHPVAIYGVEGNLLKPVSDEDRAIAFKDDHNFRFVAISPVPEGSFNVERIPVEVPAVQQGADGVAEALTYFGSAHPLTVVPTIPLELSTPFSILEFFVPDDIREGEETTLKQMTVSLENGDLVQQGYYNALTDSFTAETKASSVTVDFGEGLALQEAYTRIRFIVAPFVVPEGGLQVVFKTADNDEVTVSAFASEKEVGAEMKAGETYQTYLSGTSDGIIPVTFPVVFPMGFPTETPAAATEGYNNPTVATNTWVQEWAHDPACVTATRLSKEWVGHHGTLYCMEQPQAYMTWNWDEAILSTDSNHFIETSNSVKSGSQYVNISTVGIKGVWTNDFFEFVIPVRKFAAGSTLQLKMALYTRQGPTFWEVLYLDGEEWVSTAKEGLPAYPGAEVTAKATWAIPYLAVTSTTDNEQSVNMTFSKEVKSGEIRIRVRCVDGSILSSGINAVTTGNTHPFLSGANPAAPFYFYNPGKRNDQHIRIEML